MTAYNLRGIFVWVILAHALGVPLRAAMTEAWVHRYTRPDAGSDDAAHHIVCDAAGDVIVSDDSDNGTNGTDIVTIKYSGVDGSVIWQRRYNGPANRDDHAAGVAVDGGGNVFVAGYSYNANGNADYYIAKYAAASGALLWEQRFNGAANRDDQPAALAVDASGNVVVAGSSFNSNGNSDYYTAKYAAANGAVLWERRYNGTANRFDSAKAVAVDAGGNVVVTGESENNNFNLDYCTIKYAAATGTLLWAQRYNSPADGSDSAKAVAVDANGNVVVTGESENNNFNPDYYTVKYAGTNGALVWEQRYDGPGGYDYAKTVAVDGSGNVIVTGESYNNNFSPEYYTAKYAAANGALMWGKRYNLSQSSSASAHAVTVDRNNNVVVTGEAENSGGNTDYYTIKYAPGNGSVVWQQRYNGPTNASDHAEAVAVNANGDVFVTGGSNNGRDSDYCTLKYAAANGSLLWEKRYAALGNSIDEPRAVAIDPSGNVIVTGGSDGDYYTAKYGGAAGALLWQVRYNGPANQDDFASALALDGNGNVIVTGRSENADNADYYTARYSGTNGALLWERRYNGPANGNDVARSVAVDGSGNVIVTGESDNASGDADYYTVKYAGATGTPLWERRYNGGSDDYDEKIALDSSGNVIVTGSSMGPLSSYDYYTAKYAAATGALLWQARYNFANNSDEPKGLCVDTNGNVVVTGESYNSRGDLDYYTAKYAGTNGALIWEVRYDGPGHGDDSARAVALDAGGNVIVTGFSYNANRDTDYYTAKYAAADGALLWQRRYNGTGNSEDRAQAVAVDSVDNVVVTGFSYNEFGDADIYTACYSGADGALLWEKRYKGPSNANDYISTPRSLALGANGMVAITGPSDPDPGGNAPSDYTTIVYRDVSIAAIASGVRLRFGLTPDRTYYIQRAHAVVGPWNTVATPKAPGSGLLEVDDINPPAGAGFYRLSDP